MLGNWQRVAILAAVAALLGAALWYRAELIDKGREQTRAAVERAIQQQQRIANENAAIYETERAERQIEYRDRVREVVKYVPTGNTDCDWSTDAQRVFKSAIDAANAAR